MVAICRALTLCWVRVVQGGVMLFMVTCEVHVNLSHSTDEETEAGGNSFTWSYKLGNGRARSGIWIQVTPKDWARGGRDGETGWTELREVGENLVVATVQNPPRTFWLPTKTEPQPGMTRPGLSLFYLSQFVCKTLFWPPRKEGTPQWASGSPAQVALQDGVSSIYGAGCLFPCSPRLRDEPGVRKKNRAYESRSWPCPRPARLHTLVECSFPASGRGAAFEKLSGAGVSPLAQEPELSEETVTSGGSLRAALVFVPALHAWDVSSHHAWEALFGFLIFFLIKTQMVCSSM